MPAVRHKADVGLRHRPLQPRRFVQQDLATCRQRPSGPGEPRVTCKQMATLTLDPKVVLTAREDRPMSLKSLEKE